MSRRLCEAGSSRELIRRPEQAVYVPASMQISWDWRVRTNISPMFVHSAATYDFDRAVGARLNCQWPVGHDIPQSWELNVVYARSD